MQLSERHRLTLIEGSGIAPEVLEARGYRTVETKSELERLGFSRVQRSVPALLIPVLGPSGEIVNYQLRPDEPRIGKDGRSIKYETPANSRLTLDVPPAAREKLGDRSVPIFITEGAKKADALVSRGLCAVALLGVWGWRGTNDRGGKTALEDLEYVALDGRRAFIVFDSDVMLKPGVHRALARLKALLEGRGAEVAVIYLPAGEGATKQGVDDFFVAGHGVDELLSFASPELRELPSEAEDVAEEAHTQSAILIRYADEAELFRTPGGEAYVSVPVEENPNAL